MGLTNLEILSMNKTFIPDYLSKLCKTIENINSADIEAAIFMLREIRDNRGRLFILGIGGSAANASHAVNDFRKICNMNAYAPTDNVAELTARTNDQGWEHVFSQWLACSQLNTEDCLMIFSVGGGSRQHNLSVNLINAIDYTTTIGSKVIALVGTHGGYTATKADTVIKIPCQDDAFTTPFTESLHSVIWHLIVTHPLLKCNQTQWESIRAPK